MARIFISYRRSDCPYAAYWIYQALDHEFPGEVFLDWDIRSGNDWSLDIQSQLGQCTVFIVVIGPAWLKAQHASSGQQRLRIPTDPVRREVLRAIARKKADDIKIIPVFVGKGTKLEPQQLTKALRPLLDPQTHDLRIDDRGSAESLREKLIRLIEIVRRALEERPKTPSTPLHGIRMVTVPPEKSAARVMGDVRLPFRVSAMPVTQRYYFEVTKYSPSHFKGDDERPIENVTWLDAILFCNELSRRAGTPEYYGIVDQRVTIRGGTGFRLPTVAEWDFACAANRAHKWFFGDDPEKMAEYAWFHENSEDETRPVGTRAETPWGLFDTYGNVWEWCWDTRPCTEPSVSTNDASQPHVIRGGCCNSTLNEIPASPREQLLSETKSQFIGFRVARDAELTH